MTSFSEQTLPKMMIVLVIHSGWTRACRHHRARRTTGQAMIVGTHLYWSRELEVCRGTRSTHPSGAVATRILYWVLWQHLMMNSDFSYNLGRVADPGWRYCDWPWIP